MRTVTVHRCAGGSAQAGVSQLQLAEDADLQAILTQIALHLKVDTKHLRLSVNDQPVTDRAQVRLLDVCCCQHMLALLPAGHQRYPTPPAVLRA